MVALTRIARAWWIGLMLLMLVGCETTRTVAPEAGNTPPAGRSWIVLTVSHDKGPALPLFGAFAGAAVNLKVTIKDSAGDEQLVSSAKRNLIGSTVSDIEDRWGTIHVREVKAGRVDFTGWQLTHETGVGIRVYSPKVTPPARSADVPAGTIAYLGNVHTETLWGKNPFGIPLLAGGLPSWRDESDRDLEVLYRTHPHLRGRVVIAPVTHGLWFAQP